jgi:type VI secretion system protein ImpK
MTAPVAIPVAPTDLGARRGRLALDLQEPFTATVRLRASKQVAADAESFRHRIKQVLSAAEAEARGQGYAADDVRFALFAIIAFLDESVLNSGQPMFAQWPTRTLQEEVFGVHMAGELFYQYLQQLMTRPDSPDLADILEVYLLCLLLGFRGRYSATQGSEIPALVQQLNEKIGRARGAARALSPRWRPSPADIGTRRDRWVPRLAVAATVTALLAVMLFAWFTVSLHSGSADIRTETARLAR